VGFVVSGVLFDNCSTIARAAGISSSETTLACRIGTRLSANSQAAVILVDYVVIAVHCRQPQSLAWHR